uniref:Uncharacterized protein n=1 Tax=Paramormyrops kingsleyae TaxID=1676925 RepID=A0A3B3TBP8_9TELE
MSHMGQDRVCHTDRMSARARVCRPIQTECPTRARVCRPIQTECPAWDRVCRPIQTECPAWDRVCRPIQTECPTRDRVCHPIQTECPIAGKVRHTGQCVQHGLILIPLQCWVPPPPKKAFLRHGLSPQPQQRPPPG